MHRKKISTWFFLCCLITWLKEKRCTSWEQYIEAINLTNETLEKLKTTGAHLRGELVDAYKIMADSYEATGDYKNALVQKNQYISLNDSLMKKDKIDMVNRLEMRYRIVEKDKELADTKIKNCRIGKQCTQQEFINNWNCFTGTVFHIGFWFVAKKKYT